MNTETQKYELKTQMNFIQVFLAFLLFGGHEFNMIQPCSRSDTGDSTEVVLAERPVREMQAQLRLHFRTQDPQGWWGDPS